MAQPKKSLLTEFREFIFSRNLIEIAVGLVLALQVVAVIDAFMRGIFTPILSAIVGKRDFSEFGFDIGDARISIGIFLTAVFDLIVVGAVLFVIIKLYNYFRKPQDAGVTETELLTEIRDILRNRPL
jgi:large conductance mechanosensitive channel